jgi:hypothetical protein
MASKKKAGGKGTAAGAHAGQAAGGSAKKRQQQAQEEQQQQQAKKQKKQQKEEEDSLSDDSSDEGTSSEGASSSEETSSEAGSDGSSDTSSSEGGNAGPAPSATNGDKPALQQAPAAKCHPNGRAYTVTMAVPGSIIDNTQSFEMANFVAGQVRLPGDYVTQSGAGSSKIWIAAALHPSRPAWHVRRQQHVKVRAAGVPCPPPWRRHPWPLRTWAGAPLPTKRLQRRCSPPPARPTRWHAPRRCLMWTNW